MEMEWKRVATAAPRGANRGMLRRCHRGFQEVKKINEEDAFEEALHPTREIFVLSMRLPAVYNFIISFIPNS